ncbi:adenosylmethionine decarboxylase [Aeropyrum pernix]|nr:adenosylmethionine decarboxylase [Aeropyrum pernix]
MAQIPSSRTNGSGAQMRVFGLHVYGNFYECANTELLKSPEELEKVVLEAAREGGMTVLDIKSWKIGEGVSVVAIILESHITVHTWPEYSFATVDVYSCGGHTNPHRAFEVLAEALKPARVEKGVAERHLE